MKKSILYTVSLLLVANFFYANCSGFKALSSSSKSSTNIDLSKACDDSFAGAQPVFSGLRRLSRTELNNSVRDLFGVDTKPADKFPPDSRVANFENNASTLTVDYTYLGQLLDASETVVNAAFADSTLRSRIVTCTTQDANCAKQTLQRLIKKAYHRKVTTEDLDSLLTIFTTTMDQGQSFEESLKLAVRGVMTSPDFLYRFVGSKSASLNDAKSLDDYELAARLSYFLWSSIPDDELILEAERGSLRANLEVQVRRMLRSPKASALVDEFASSWLALQNLSEANPSKILYPQFNESLRSDMMNETKSFLREVLLNDRNPSEIIGADYSMLNEQMANHYGIPGVTGTQFRKVDLASQPRRGVLGQASILSLTSNSTDSSIVRRGKFILDRITCSSPPPPDMVRMLEDAPVGGGMVESQRERLERHRASSACFGCHAVMDPMGIVLDNFDPIGGFRTTFNGQTLDTRAKFPDGKTYSSEVELAQALSQDITFKQCFAKNLMNFALGHQFVGTEQCQARQIASEQFTADKKFSDLILGIVKSVSFLNEGEQQ